MASHAGSLSITVATASPYIALPSEPAGGKRQPQPELRPRLRVLDPETRDGKGVNGGGAIEAAAEAKCRAVAGLACQALRRVGEGVPAADRIREHLRR